jgi:4-amino-4-deoxy-L-arabinose transferase-like glycosyltransferase
LATAFSKPFSHLSQETAGRYSRLFILVSLVLHLVHTWYWSDYDLAQDEAHYWDWSRHLDWSYYSKGPLVAWVIAAANFTLGGLSEQLTGSLTAAIRTPAAIFGTFLVFFLCRLTEEVLGSKKLGLLVVVSALTIPPIAAVSTIMTIDSPYTCLWAAALLLAWWALNSQSKRAWVLLGFIVGSGILAKYTMAVFYPSLGLFLIFSATHRKNLLQPWVWISGMVAIVVASPILWWNWQHAGVTFAHVGQLAGVTHDNTKHWIGPFKYVGEQAALLLGYWFVTWVCSMSAYLPGKSPSSGITFLWWMSAPMFLLFFGFSVRTGGGEVNWPVTAYLAGLPLCAYFLSRQMESTSKSWRVCTMLFLLTFLGFGSLLVLIVHKSDFVYPILVKFLPAPTSLEPAPLRRLDPVCRLRGWRFLAGEVDKVREELSQSGKEPILTATHWSIPGELGVYCKGHPQAYSIGLVAGDRHSQYDLWNNPIDYPEEFMGRDFIVVGGLPPRLAASFESVSETREVIYRTPSGYPVANFWIQVCRGFKGFPKVEEAKRSW